MMQQWIALQLNHAAATVIDGDDCAFHVLTVRLPAS